MSRVQSTFAPIADRKGAVITDMDTDPADELVPSPFACAWDADAEALVPLYPAVAGVLPRPEQALYVRVRPCLATAPRAWRITVNDAHTTTLFCAREAVAAALDALAPALAPWTVDDAGPDALSAHSFYARVQRRPPSFAERPLLSAHVRAHATGDDDVHDVSAVCAWEMPPAARASFVWAAAHMPWDPAPLYDAFGPALPAELARTACPACRAAPAAHWRDPTTQTEFCPGFVELREKNPERRDSSGIAQHREKAAGGVVAFYRACGAAAAAPPMSELDVLAAYQGNGEGSVDAHAAPTFTPSGSRVGAGPVPYDSATYVLGRWSGSTYNLRAEQGLLSGAPRIAPVDQPLGAHVMLAHGAKVGRHVAAAPFVGAFLAHVVYHIERYAAEPTPQLVRDLLRAQRHWEHTAASSRVSATLKRVPTDLAPLLAAAAGLPPARFAPLPRAVVALHGRLSTIMTAHRRRRCARNPRAAAGGRPHAATTLAYAHALLWVRPPRDTPLSTPRYGKSDRPCRESRARVKATLDAAARALLAGTPYADMPLPVYEPFPPVAMAVFAPAPGSRPIDIDRV